MPADRRRQRVMIEASSRPSLPRHIKLRRDETRDRWIILAPERVLTPSETAVAVLTRCDGERTLADIARDLATQYRAPHDEILLDIIALVQELADKGYVKA